ncbi:MAG: tRNA (cytidine(34)-2'-O)-methyltransferase [Clostridia bacterium]|nr:tRNA (cytidine(34)-2'-O)-methyltransferase [Clostridia bacterium]
MNIVLVAPEIPQNTGNIARTCAATGAHLHLIRPLGFSLADKYLKRAGLDYWNLMRYTVYDTLDAFYRAHPGAVCHYASKKAARSYCDVTYGADDFLVFGRESRGLDEDLLRREYGRCIRIPMRAEARSLNLSNSVAIVLYEALRQQNFPGLLEEGTLTADGVEAWVDYV